MNNFSLFLCMALQACGSNSQQLPISSVPGITALPDDSMHPLITALPIVTNHTGELLPNLEDTTLLKTVFGSYIQYKENYVHRFCCETWTEDSVDMKVEERFASDSLQIIFIRGCKHYGTVMHSDYREIGLILVPVNNGWQIADMYRDDDMKDFSSKTFAGAYGDMLLLKTGYVAIYGGGYGDEWEQYTIVQNRKFRNDISFNTGAGNGATEFCCCAGSYTDDENNDESCGCFEATGKLSYRYDKQLHCIIFDYAFSWSDYTCHMAKLHAVCAMSSVTYFNADTSLVTRQQGCEDGKTLEKINLDRKRIEAVFGK